MSNGKNHKDQMWSSSNGMLARVPAGVIQESLDPKVYMLNFNPMSGYFLSVVHDFTVPTELYGTIEADVKRIFDTFNKRTNSTGILLTGVMGSGKTLLAKLVSAKAMEIGMPVIIIQRAYTDPAFMEFIQNINQECAILFEEMDKVYSDVDDQNKILSLFDGLFSNKKLFLVTANNQHKVSGFIVSRPGRCFYHLKFEKLSAEFIVDYCNQNLNDTKHTDSVLLVSKLVSNFNFDQLQALVEEMNRYNENAMQSLRWLNIESYPDHRTWDQRVLINGEVFIDTRGKQDYAQYISNAYRRTLIKLLPNEFMSQDLKINLNYDLDDYHEDQQTKIQSVLAKFGINSPDFEWDFDSSHITKVDLVNGLIVFEGMFDGLNIRNEFIELTKPQTNLFDNYLGGIF